MSLEWEQVIVDSVDPQSLGRWWAEALGWVIIDDTDGVEIRPSEDRLPGILFGNDDSPKTMKNRLHFDFRPDDQQAEVERLVAHGARHADVGQTGDEPWVVLLDPEDNEFCVLSGRA